MSELSPQAQAVLDAANGTQCGGSDDILNDSRWIAAAALRAAAEHVGPSEILPSGYVYSAPAEEWHYQFKLKAQRQLRAIATELEGADG